MFHSSHYPRSRFFEGEGSRSKSSQESASIAIRKPSNHPPSVVAPEYPNIEMLEASQLSMDSELRTYSQPSNFLDVPCGQPSASMSSFSSSHEQLRYYPNQRASEHRSERRGAVASMPATSQSSFSGGSIKSSLRKTKNKAKKTRFADVRDSRSSRGGRSSSQKSYTPLSQSSSNSQGSQGTSRNGGRRIQLQRPSAAMHATNGHRSSHSGRASDFIPPRQQHASTENPNASRNDSKHQRRLSATAGLQEPMFSRIATPLKPINIPYPPIKFQPRNKRQSPVQPTKRQDELYGSENDPNTATSNSRKDSEQGAPCEAKRDGATKRGNDAQELYTNEDRTSSKEFAVTNEGATQDGPSSAASASTNSNASSKIVVGSGMGSYNDENERMETFKVNLEKLLSEAKAAVQEELKAKLGEGVTAIQEASKSNLDMIGQKRDEAEKAIESLHESTKTQLEEAACVSLQKVEACTETSLSKLKKFTETWLSTSYNAIANRFKPYLASSTEIEAENIQNDSIGFRTPIVQERRGTSGPEVSSTGKNRLKRKALAPLDDSSTTDQAEKTSSSGDGGRSPAQHSGRSTQSGSLGETSTRPLRRSKRMKQQKERKDQKCEGNTSGHTTISTTVPRADKQQKTRLSTATSHAKTKVAQQSKTSLPLKVVKSAKTLCVTPTEATSRSMKKQRTKPTSGSKKSQSEINKLKPLRSKRRKRHKTPSPLSKKRAKPSCQSSQRSVPSEVELTFNDVQLSPLEGPNLYSFPSTKPTPKSIQPLERKKRTPPRTYGRKKKAFFDILDNTGVFCF